MIFFSYSPMLFRVASLDFIHCTNLFEVIECGLCGIYIHLDRSVSRKAKSMQFFGDCIRKKSNFHMH